MTLVPIIFSVKELLWDSCGRVKKVVRSRIPRHTLLRSCHFYGASKLWTSCAPESLRASADSLSFLLIQLASASLVNPFHFDSSFTIGKINLTLNYHPEKEIDVDIERC